MNTRALAIFALAATGSACFMPVPETRHEPDAGRPCVTPCTGNTICDRGECVPDCPLCPTAPEHEYATCSGACAFECRKGFHRCGVACVSDDAVRTCGAECLDCPFGPNEVPSCESGLCRVQCLPQFHRCGQACVSNASVSSCGSACEPCNAPLDARPTCDGTSCGFECQPGQHLCGGRCALATSALACGPSCTLCPVPPNAVATCVADTCSWTCLPGSHACGSSCELDDSPAACGTACVTCTEPVPANSRRKCQQGSCAWECLPGFHRCGATCEADDSVLACGPNCRTCPISAIAEPACVASACVLRCQAGLVWSSGQCRPVTSVAAGRYHSCALTSLGAVSCWGENADGQLGNGTTVSSASPVEVIGLSSAALEISVGARHSCALLASREVACWGWNWYWQVGQSIAAPILSVPYIVPGLGPVRGLSAGELHTCAVSVTGEVSCWGYSAAGQVGHGTGSRLGPGTVLGLGEVTLLSAGEAHTCALQSDAGTICWGSGTNGLPVQVPTPDPFAALSAGTSGTCGVTRAGVVECWDRSALPAPVAGAPTSIAVEARGSHRCLLAADGGPWCWGSNVNGELGDGTTTDRPSPVQLRLPTRVTHVANGTTHTCAVTADGRVFCWGSNQHGQIGDGTQSDRWLPTPVVDGP